MLLVQFNDFCNGRCIHVDLHCLVCSLQIVNIEACIYLLKNKPYVDIFLITLHTVCLKIASFFLIQNDLWHFMVIYKLGCVCVVRLYWLLNRLFSCCNWKIIFFCYWFFFYGVQLVFSCRVALIYYSFKFERKKILWPLHVCYEHIWSTKTNQLLKISIVFLYCEITMLLFYWSLIIT